MFRTKTRTETLQDDVVALAVPVRTLTGRLRKRVVPAVDQLRVGVVPVVGQAAGSAKEWGQPRVEAARVWAKPHVEHGIEVAAPRLESAVSSLAPKVDTARDKIVDELLPRIAEAIAAGAAASTAARDEALTRGQGAAAVISGGAVAKPKHKRKGRILLAAALLAAIGAGVAAFLKNSAPKDDPWVTPLADPYVASSNGRHSNASSVENGVEKADADALLIDPLIDPLDDTGVPSGLNLAPDAAKKESTDQD